MLWRRVVVGYPEVTEAGNGGPKPTSPGVHLSVLLGFTCPGVHLFGDSLVRAFRRFGVASPRDSHSQGDAVLLKYIHGRCCSAEIYTWAMLFCWSIVVEFVLPFC